MGLTVLETTIALAVLALMLIGLSGLFLRLLASSEKSGDQTTGIMLAERLLRERVEARNFGSVASPESRYLYTHDGSSPTEFVYRVTSTPMVLNSGEPEVYYMDVEVQWMGGTRQGQGQLVSRVGRLVTP